MIPDSHYRKKFLKIKIEGQTEQIAKFAKNSQFWGVQTYVS